MKRLSILMILTLLLAAPLMAAATVNASTNQVRVAIGQVDYDKSDFENGIYVPVSESVTYINFPDVQPVIIDGRVYVTVRPFAEAYLGEGSVKWDAATSTAIVAGSQGVHSDENGESYELMAELTMRPGYAHVTYKNGNTGEAMDTATPEILPRIVNGRFMVPIATLDYVIYGGDTIAWDSKTKTVYILHVAG